MSKRSSLSYREQQVICITVSVGGKLNYLVLLERYSKADIVRTLRRDPRFARRFKAARGRKERLAPDLRADRPVKSWRDAIRKHRAAQAELDELLFLVEQRRAF